MDRDAFGDPSIFKVGRLQAYCPQCRGAEFVRSQRRLLDKVDLLVCCGCGAEHYRTGLMQQITDKVIDDAERVLSQARPTTMNAGHSNEQLAARLKEAEELLLFPAVESHVERASKLLLLIARQAPSAAVRDAAMKAISLAALARGQSTLGNEAANLQRLIEQIRSGLQP